MKTVTVKIPDDLHKKLKQACLDHERTLQDFIAEAIEILVETHSDY